MTRIGGRKGISAGVGGPPPPVGPAYDQMILARGGLLGYWAADGTLKDYAPAHNDGSWTLGSPTTAASPITSDGSVAIVLDGTDIGTISRIAAYDRGDGPFSVEFWSTATAPTPGQRLVGMSDNVSGGWTVYAKAGQLGLHWGDDNPSLYAALTVTAGWHHYAFTRGAGADGHAYMDGVDVSNVYASHLFTTAAGVPLLVEGIQSFFGLAYYNRELTAAEAAASATMGGIVILPPAPAVISGIVVTPATTSASVGFSTDLPTECWVEYGPSSTPSGGPYPSSTTPEITYTSGAHAVTIPGLVAATAYRMRVWSLTGQGLTTVSTSSVFTTSAAVGGLPVIEGYGKDALSTLGAGLYTVSNLNTSGAGSFMGALQWLDAGNEGTVKITASGTVAVPDGVTRVTGASNFFIDGRSGNLSLTGGCVFFMSCAFFAVVNIRHRGGWDGGQDADDFTFGGCHDYAVVNVSVSGFYDEAIDIAYPSYNVTMQDVLWGPGGSAHNFANGMGCFTTRVSVIRPVYIDMEYRTPRVEYWSTNLTGYSSPCWNGTDYDGGAPPYVVCDLVNPIWIDCPVVVCSYGRGRVNVRSPYIQNSGSGFAGSAKYPMPAGSAWSGYCVTYEVSIGSIASDYGLGTGSNPFFPVAASAVATEMSTAAARAYAKANSGCLPHDSFDTTHLARIA